MKRARLIVFFVAIFFTVFVSSAHGQCAICTKTAGQLGEKPARGLNTGIIYLMLAPFTIVGYIGFRWWRAEKNYNAEAE